MNFESPAIRNGFFGGLAAVILALLFYLFNTKSFLSLSGFLIIILYIICVIRGVREQKATMDHFPFVEALKTGFLTYIVASLVYTIFHYVLMNFVDPGLVDMQREVAVEAIEKMSGFMGEDQMEAAIDAIESQDLSFTVSKALITFAWGLIFPGIIIALIVAAFTKDAKKVEY